jgi:hypothetical protein
MNCQKMHSVEAELFHVDKQMDTQTYRHDEANRCFSQFLETA